MAIYGLFLIRLFRYTQDSKELKFYAFGKTVPDHGNPQSMCIESK